MSNYPVIIKIVNCCKLLRAVLRTLEGDDLKDCLCVFSGKQKCPEGRRYSHKNGLFVS